MKKEEKIICDFIYDFVDKNYKKINLIKVESIKSKKGILEEVKNNFQDAMWVFTEVARRGMDKVYLQELYCDIYGKCDFSVIKIGNRYIKIECVKYDYIATFCKPKYKRVMYFD